MLLRDELDTVQASRGLLVMAQILLIVPAEIGYRELATRTVASVCKIARPLSDLGAIFRDEVVSAVGEAFNNSVFHAYADSEGDVTLQIEVNDVALTVDILDCGRSFNLEGVPDPNLDVPQESGMGLYIIRSFVDEISYCPGQPNRLRLVKLLPTP